MKKIIKLAIAGVLSCLAFGAQANLITNGSFEDPDLSSVDNNGGTSWELFNSIEGWEASTGKIEIQAGTVTTAQDGDQYIELDARSNSVVYQEITGLDVGSYYTLSFWYYPRSTEDTSGLSVYWSDSLTYDLDDLVISVSSSYDLTTVWEEYVETLVATSETMYLYLVADGTSDGIGAFVDNISLTAVPEPATLGLLAISLIGFGAARRRKAKA